MTADERAALVEHLRDRNNGFYSRKKAADLLEADGKRLALAEKTIAELRHQLEVTGYWHQKDPLFTIVDRYDAAKETLS